MVMLNLVASAGDNVDPSFNRVDGGMREWDSGSGADTVAPWILFGPSEWYLLAASKWQIAAILLLLLLLLALCASPLPSPSFPICWVACSALWLWLWLWLVHRTERHSALEPGTRHATPLRPLSASKIAVLYSLLTASVSAASCQLPSRFGNPGDPCACARFRVPWRLVSRRHTEAVGRTRARAGTLG